MSRFVLSVFFFFLCVLTVLAKPHTVFAAERLTRLPNGFTVYVIKDTRFPLVCTRLYVNTGSVNETPKQAGISHLLEHMVFKATDHRPKGQAVRDVEDLGGYINATTDFDRTTYITDMPATHWRTGMDVVKDMAFQARLDSEELEKEKLVVISELEIGEDSPVRRLSEDLQVAGLRNTVYGRPIIGFRDTVMAITVDDLRAYVTQWYQPQNMMLLVAGDIDPEVVLAHAEKLFGEMKNSSVLPYPEDVKLTDAAGGPLVEIRKGPWKKAYLGLAFPVPGLRDLRSVDLDMISYLLGGDKTSQFYRKYKYEKQLVDSISVHNMSFDRAGLLTVTAQLDVEKIALFWTELTKDLAVLKTAEFSPEAIGRAAFNLADDMDRAGETLSGLASWRGTVRIALGGEEAERNVRTVLHTTDAPRLQLAVRDWITSGQARLRILAPQSAELPDLEAILQKNWPTAKTVAESKADRGQAEKREILDLGNGRTLIFIPDATVPYISLSLMMPGGNALTELKGQGLAELTARVLTDGCADFDAEGVSRFFSQRAASVSVKAGLQTFGLSLTGPSRFNADYFAMLDNILNKPRFAEEEIRREANTMKAVIRQREDRPMAYLFAKLNPFLFSEKHAYGFDGLGTLENLDRFAGGNGGNIRAFWKCQVSQPWVLSIAGDFNKNEVLEMAKKLPVPEKSVFSVPQPEWGKKRELTINLPGRNQAHLLRIFKAVPLTHPDAPAQMLLQNILSGQSGLLFSSLREEQGLGYSVTAFFSAMPKAGFMAFYIGTTPDKLEQAAQGFAQAVADLKTKPLPEKLLRAAYNQLNGDYYRERQSLSSRADEAATDAVLHNTEDFHKELISRAGALSPSDIQAVAARYLITENAYEVRLLP
ncbi:MAG: insulinase family protein [Desulfovibrio sp.]|jgi:zinc protease|nr:insulinase family protein [Desulfovibrio sp.]